jgi:hypothetical protein
MAKSAATPATPKTAPKSPAKPVAPKGNGKPRVKEPEPVEEVTDEEITEVEGEEAEPQEPEVLPDPIDRSEVKYDKITVVNKTVDGEGPLTPDELKEIVGYTEDPTTAKVNGFSEKEPLDTLPPPNGAKFWFLYNTKNRPYYPAVARSYAQSLLTGKWEANGESAVIGKSGECLSIQHRGAGLLLAESERAANPEMWAHLWGDGPVTMPTILVFGVDETDRVVNTMDTGKGRTGTDMLFRTEIMLQAFPAKQDRRIAGNIVANAVKMLWDRMGVKENSFAPQLNQAELHDFILRHPKIVESAAHIMKEDTYDDKKRGRISNNVIPAGYAAAVLFLMGASDTDADEYNKTGTDEWKKVAPSQDGMDLGKWDKALKFWSDVANQNSTILAGVRQAFVLLSDKFMGRGLPENVPPLVDDNGNPVEVETNHVSIEEKLIVLAKAWNQFKRMKPVKAEECLPAADSVHYDDKRRRKVIGEIPNFGGVDRVKTISIKEATPETPDDPNAPQEDEGTEQAPQKTPKETIDYLRLQFGIQDNDVAIFKPHGANTFNLWNPNTRDKELMKSLGMNPNKPEEKGDYAGLIKQSFAPDKYDPIVAKAVAAGRKVYLVETFGTEKPPQCTPLTGDQPGKTGGKPKPAPKK